MKKIVRVSSFAALVAVAIAFLSSGAITFIARAQQPAHANAEVKIDNFSFAPATITVPVGTTVRWINRDDIPHTVVSDKKEFKSKVLDTNDDFAFTFAKTGAYPYFCSLHPKMTAKVVVE